MNENRTATKGATIMELLVSFSIMLILLLLATQLFISSWRRFNKTNAVQAVNSNAAIALDRLSKDFRETSREDITFITEKYLLFRSPRSLNGTYQYDADSKPDWVSWILYYRFPQDPVPGTESVLARRIISTGSSTVLPIAASYTSDLKSGVTAGYDTRVTIAGHNIKSLKTVKMDNPDGTSVYTITVETEIIYQKNVYSTVLTRSLTPMLSTQY